MERSDLNRLNTHLGLLPDSIKSVCTDKQIDDMLQRWPALANAHEAISDSRRRQIARNLQQTPSMAESHVSDELHDVPAS